MPTLVRKTALVATMAGFAACTTLITARAADTQPPPAGSTAASGAPGTTAGTSTKAMPSASAPSAGAAVFQLADSASDTGMMSFEAVSDSWNRKIVVRFDPAAVKGPLTIKGMALMHEDGGAPAPLLVLKPGEQDAKAQAIVDPPASPLELFLKADLPKRGVYVGSLQMQWGSGAVEIHQVKVNRTPQAFTASDAMTVADGSWRLSFDYPFVHVIDSFGIAVQAPARHKVSVTPEFFQMRRLGASGGDKINTDVSNATFTVGKDTVGGKAAVEIPANTVQHIRVTVPGLLAAGKYETTIKLMSPDHDPLDRVYTLVVKRSWIGCLLLVWLGTGAALWLKYLSRNKRPKLVVRQTVAKLQWLADSIRQQISLDSAETTTLDAIQARITKWYTEAMTPDAPDATWGTNARNALLLEESKLHAFVNWVNARRALNGADLPEAKRAEYARTLSEVGLAIAADAALDPAQSQKLLAALMDLQSAMRKSSEGRVTQLLGEVGTAARTASNPDAASHLQNATDLGQEAKAELQSGHFTAFAALFDQSQLAYIRGLASNLKDMLPTREDRAQIAAASLFPIDTGPQDDLVQAMQATDAQRARFYYERARSALKDSQAQAAKAMDRAEVQGNAPLFAAAGNLKQVDVPDAAPDGPPLPPASTLAVLPFPNTNVRDDTAELATQTQRIDRAIMAFTLVATGLLGVELLWVPEEAWGQLNDWLKALLWGLGLGQITLSAFQGVASVQTELTR